MDNILEYIEKLKMKPEHIRRRYAFVVSFAISFTILAGWLGSYGLRTSPILAEQNSSTSSVSEAKVKKPITSLTASVGDAFKDIKDIFVGTNKFEYNNTGTLEVKTGNR